MSAFLGRPCVVVVGPPTSEAVEALLQAEELPRSWWGRGLRIEELSDEAQLHGLTVVRTVTAPGHERQASAEGEA